MTYMMSHQQSSVFGVAAAGTVMLLVISQCITCSSSECSNPISLCNGTNYSQLAEYVLVPQSVGLLLQSVCLTSNSSNHTTSNAAAAAISIQNTSSVVQYCTSNVSLDPALACYSNESSTFEGVYVLFVSLNELTKEDDGRALINITAVDANGNDVVQFTLDYAPIGIYPVSDSPVTVRAGNSVSLEWISYEAPISSSLSFTDYDSMTSPQMLTSQSIRSPPCVEPSDGFPVKPALPVMTVYSVNSASLELSGTYTVTSSNGFSSSIALTVKRNGLPVLDVVDSPVIHHQVGASAQILCSIEYSDDRPSWHFNNVPITNNDQYSIRRKRLSITNVSVDTGGWYTCATANEYGTVFKDFLLIPVDKPSIVVGSALPSNVSYVIAPGSSLVLPCTTTGLPPPTITWYKDNEQVIADNDEVMIDSVSGALIISNYTADQRPTNGYMCSAHNIADTTNSSWSNVNVTDTESMSSNTAQVYYSVGMNDTITLECPMHSSTNSTYRWYHNGVDMVATTETITVLRESDGSSGGVYCCQLTVDQIVHDTRCFVMNMEIPAEVSASNLVYTSVQSGRNTSFFISTESISNVNNSRLVWYRNNSIINENTVRFSVHQDVQTLSTLSIQNSQPSDSGRYSVRGTKPYTSFSIDFDLEVVDTSCNNNLLSSFNGEGDSVSSDWTGLGDTTSDPSFLYTYNTDTHFTLNPDMDTPQPSISQTVQLSTSGGAQQHKAKISCRMRSTTPHVMLPQVRVNMESTNSTILTLTLSNDTQEAWQWVVMETSTLTSNTMEMFTISMVVNRVDSSSFDGFVYFDDLCFSVVSENTPTSSSTQSVQTSSTSLVYVTASPTVTSQPTDSTSNTLDEILRYLDEYKFYIIIPVGGTLFIIFWCCCICCIYCCCCRKKNKNQKTPLLNELSKSLEERDNIELTPAEKQATLPGVPVYIEPGINGTAIYLEHNQQQLAPSDTSTNHPRLLSAGSYDYPSRFLSNTGGATGSGTGRNRVSGPYDYPSLSKSVGSTSPSLPEESYDYAHSPNLRHHAGPKLSRETSPLPSTPTITTTSETHNRSPRGSEGNVHVPIGAVRKLSDLFEMKKVEPTLSDEENPYDTCQLPVDPSSPWSKDPLLLQKQQSSSTLLPHHQLPTNSSNTQISPEIKDNPSHDTDNDSTYEAVCVLDTFPRTDDPYSTISPNATRLPLPLPSPPEKGKDSSGYLVVLNKKDKVEENPYNIIESHYDNPEEGHDRQSKSSITHSADGYLLVIDKNEKVEDKTYDDLESTCQKDGLDNEYDYCHVNQQSQKNETEEDDTYVVPSLELSNDEEENIYY